MDTASAVQQRQRNDSVFERRRVAPKDAAKQSTDLVDNKVHVLRADQWQALILAILGVLVVCGLALSNLQQHMATLTPSNSSAVGHADGAVNGTTIPRRRSLASLDYLEIGTSDFDTLAEAVNRDAVRGMSSSALPRGVSVEALPLYVAAVMNKTSHVPHSAHAILNYAVVAAAPHNATIEVFYIHPNDLRRYKLPQYLRGCNSVGAPHPTALRKLRSRSLLRLLRQTSVPVVSLAALLDMVGGCRLGLLKIDVEGMDAALLLAYASFLWARRECRADLIRFEVGNFTGATYARDISAAIAALRSVGYVELWQTSTPSGGDPILHYSAADDLRFRGTTPQLLAHMPDIGSTTEGDPSDLPASDAAAALQAPYLCPPYLSPHDIDRLLAAGAAASSEPPFNGAAPVLTSRTGRQRGGVHGGCPAPQTAPLSTLAVKGSVLRVLNATTTDIFQHVLPQRCGKMYNMDANCDAYVTLTASDGT